MDEGLQGSFKVRRVSGLLPPFGLSKTLKTTRGVTKIVAVPLMPFRITGRELRYIGLPLHDVLVPREDGGFLGEGFVFGKRFCRFRLEPV